MIGRELVNQTDISLSQVKSLLEKRKKDVELSYEQKAAYEYSKDQAKLGVRKAEELVKKLLEIEKIDEHTAVMIADNGPTDKGDLLLIMEKKRHGLTEKELKQVLDIVAEYSA
ncbi:RNA polymerase Rpb4 family protein [archaeon]|nr:RNA polymerase Rpb4 family protein [archaeon]